MKIHNLLYISVLICTMFACKSEKYDHKGKHPLVQVGNHFLYRENVEELMPVSFSSEDSMKVADKYIHQWIEDELLYGLAKENLLNVDEINEKVESFKKNLMIHLYQDQLMNQKVDMDCSSDSLHRFYVENSNLFVASAPLVKGLFIKVPSSSSEISKVRRLYMNRSEEAVDKLEKYSLQHAVKYDYFYNKWLALKDVKLWLPQSDKVNIMGVGHYEWKDDNYFYFLNITDYLREGEIKPYEYVLPDVKELLIEKKKLNFISSMKKEIMSKAEKNKKVKFY